MCMNRYSILHREGVHTNSERDRGAERAAAQAPAAAASTLQLAGDVEYRPQITVGVLLQEERDPS
ncbi:hypothetical protein PG993_009359 [Apiospora rasikravindrae]|uniref:Uncharacterized protein n=1 Tax=Apiospora rasikravindrae TaxID=990691 RepID=A0ABR1SJ63_9PEZI